MLDYKGKTFGELYIEGAEQGNAWTTEEYEKGVVYEDEA